MYKKTKGSARKDLDEKVKKIHIYKGHMKSVRELYQEMENMKDEVQKWKAKHKDLKEEKERIYQEMIMSITKNEKGIEGLQKWNRELENYVKALEQAMGITAYKGKAVSDVIHKVKNP